MKKVLIVVVSFFFIVVGAAYALAQEEGETDESDEKRIEVEKKGARIPTQEELEEMKKVGRLPEKVQEAREKGTEEEELKGVVEGVKKEEITVDEANETVEMMKKNTEEGKSNKGIVNFVREQKKKGLKGKELSNAIQAELAVRKELKASGKKTKPKEMMKKKKASKKRIKEAGKEAEEKAAEEAEEEKEKRKAKAMKKTGMKEKKVRRDRTQQDD